MFRYPNVSNDGEFASRPEQLQTITKDVGIFSRA